MIYFNNVEKVENFEEKITKAEKSILRAFTRTRAKKHKLHDVGVLGFVFHSMTASLNFPLLCFFSCLAYA